LIFQQKHITLKWEEIATLVVRMPVKILSCQIQICKQCRIHITERRVRLEQEDPKISTAVRVPLQAKVFTQLLAEVVNILISKALMEVSNDSMLYKLQDYRQ